MHATFSQTHRNIEYKHDNGLTDYHVIYPKLSAIEINYYIFTLQIPYILGLFILDCLHLQFPVLICMLKRITLEKTFSLKVFNCPPHSKTAFQIITKHNGTVGVIIRHKELLISKLVMKRELISGFFERNDLRIVFAWTSSAWKTRHDFILDIYM